MRARGARGLDHAVKRWYANKLTLRAVSFPVYAAEGWPAQITIDGTAAPLLTLTTPSGRWVAVRRHEDLTVTIAARDLDPATITIEPIPDPAGRLLGPEPEDS